MPVNVWLNEASAVPVNVWLCAPSALLPVNVLVKKYIARIRIASQHGR
jgi:hypothetical protein